MVVSKTGVLLVTISFFTLISLFVGAFENANNTNIEDLGETEYKTGVFSFFKNVVSGYASLPVEINILLFGTLGTILTWLVVSSLPTLNGGS